MNKSRMQFLQEETERLAEALAFGSISAGQFYRYLDMLKMELEGQHG